MDSTFSKRDKDFTVAKSVKIWLWVGLFMVFMQIAIGGITRLTGSGLSITKWEVVRGTIPPLNNAQWEAEFELYRQTPQYQMINQGMTMPEFQFIYFWEYFHRFWARLMGFVFLFPFLWFLWKKMLPASIRSRLVVLVLLAGLEGFFGWIMVKSGLTKRPWVNAYNLTLHLSMGLVIFSHLLWTIFMAYRPQWSSSVRRAGGVTWGLVLLVFIQIALGAMMSGTKAGLNYPTWPDMNGAYLPDLLFDAQNWRAVHFVDYDSHPFLPTLIQFLHRNVAYLVTIFIVALFWKYRRAQQGGLRNAYWLLLGALSLQVLLGIFTLINCRGHIPVLLGVLHQAGAVLLLSLLLWTKYRQQAD